MEILVRRLNVKFKWIMYENTRTLNHQDCIRELDHQTSDPVNLSKLSHVNRDYRLESKDPITTDLVTG